jgi:hypothetical protein
MMTKVERIKQQIADGTYRETAPEALEAVVDGVLAEGPMTFEEWWLSEEADGLRLLFWSLNAASVEGALATYVTLLVRTAWTHGEQYQMHLDHAAEMERLKG